MTRVVFLGKASREQKKIYNTVLSAQNRAIEHLGRWRGNDLVSSEVEESEKCNGISKEIRKSEEIFRWKNYPQNYFRTWEINQFCCRLILLRKLIIMSERVDLTRVQANFDAYRVQSALSVLEPVRDEINYLAIRTIAKTRSMFNKLMPGALCINVEKSGRDLYLSRRFEANANDCKECPLIAKEGIGCVIYDRRVKPRKKTAIRTGYKDLR